MNEGARRRVSDRPTSGRPTSGKTLAAIIAGGQSRRFGSDKAAALLNGQALLDHVRADLKAQADEIIVVGREWPGMIYVADRPSPNMGPLGGLCAALHYGFTHGYETVLLAGCDTLPVPDYSVLERGSTPVVVAGQPLLGVWPSLLAPKLDQHLAKTNNLSVYHWLDKVDARQITLLGDFFNLNTPEDFDRYAEVLTR